MASGSLFRLLWLTVITVAAAACVSTEMRSLIGSPIQEAEIAYGAPVHVIDMPDGRKAYQFRYGGGPVVLPGQSSTTATAIGSTVVANTVSSPAAILETKGCLLTFIAAASSSAWIIEDIRVPRDLVC
jgi:hypothetical protein